MHSHWVTGHVLHWDCAVFTGIAVAILVIFSLYLYSLYQKAALKGKPKEVKYVVAKKSQGTLYFLS